MRSARALALTLTALTLAWAGSVLGTPSTVSYQGRLLTSGGTPVADGNYAVTFTLWTDSVAGSLIWTELQDVHVTGGEGLFACQLGSLQPLGGDLIIHASDNLYLQTSVAGEVLVPRLALSSVPHAFSSSSVHHVESGAGSMEMMVGDDTTRIDASHEGFSTLIDSYVHLVDDRGLLGLRAYGAGTTAGSSSHSEVSVDEARHDLDHDDDGDGMAELSVWEKVDNTDAASGTAVDVDDDGDPDVGSSSSAKISRAVLKTFFQTGDFPTQSQVIDSADASGAYHSIESSDPDESSSSNVRVRLNELEAKLQAIGLLARSSITNSLTPTTCGVAIQTKGTGADKNRTIGGTCDDSSAVQVIEVDEDGDGIAEGKGINSVKVKTSGYVTASSRMTCDADDDGIPENEAAMVVTPTTSSVAIQTKGTGADKNRTIGGTCDDSSAVHLLEIDDDGDGIAEGRGIISVKSATGSGSMSASSRMTCDADDDGIPENEASMVVTPTTSSVAIQTKGTGADKNRTIGGTCDDSSATQTMTVDDDGDGFAEATAAVTSVSSMGGGGGGAGGSAYARMSSDSDDDGIPENDATMIVTPATSSVAIKTKGTGADPNRVVSQTTGQDAELVVEAAGKNIGIYVSDISGQASITMTDGTLGTVDTTIIIDGATKRFGIGVSAPTNPIEHSSGAKLTAGGVWTNASDANAKENFQPVDGEELLEKLSALAITKWNYKADKETEHIGPTAQDFQQTFGVGSDGKSISTIDPSGIALAAIQELTKRLNAQNQALSQENAQLRRDLDELKSLVRDLAAAK